MLTLQQLEESGDTLVASSSIVGGQCGIGTYRSLYKLSQCHKSASYYNQPNGDIGYPIEELKHKGGAGFVGTGFIAQENSRLSYEWLCKNKRLIFQTPVRNNKNSNNLFFYAMFDDHNTPGEVGYLPTLTPNWPFKEV